jgi:hypothetical protein
VHGAADQKDMPMCNKDRICRDTSTVAEIVVRRILTQEEIKAGRGRLSEAGKDVLLREPPRRPDTVLEAVARETMLWYVLAKQPKPEAMLPMRPNKLLNLLVQTVIYAWKTDVFGPFFKINWDYEPINPGDEDRSDEDCLMPYGLYRKDVKRMTEKEAMKYLPGVLRYACLWNDPLVMFMWKEAGVEHPGSLMEWLEELPNAEDWATVLFIAL